MNHLWKIRPHRGKSELEWNREIQSKSGHCQWGESIGKNGSDNLGQALTGGILYVKDVCSEKPLCPGKRQGGDREAEWSGID